MPLVRRKKVVLHGLPDFVTPETATTSARDVFYIPQTGEIFPDYESYSARMAFYSMKVFQCELTGKSGLDYFQALDSERSEAQTLHSRFPSRLKAPILAAVQWQIMGRLDHLVELVYERFVNRYFPGEKVFVDVDGEKYYARIISLFPPKGLTNSSAFAANGANFEPHSIGIDLRVPQEEALARDDPMDYFYTVKLIEDSEQENTEGNSQPHNDSDGEKWSGSEMEVKANSLSRDRLSFSKSILRRFIRDCVDRDPAVASPWTVKRVIAEQHGVATEMPEEVRRAIDGAKAGEKEKRKKVWEEKLEAEGSASKRRRKGEELDSEAHTPTPALPEAKPKPRGPVKYPIDDLDVAITDREKKTGKKVARPQMDRDVPFGGSFEPFLMTWAFFQSFGSVLKISSFTLDDYENAIRHNIPELPCNLLAETHACLLTVARERAGTKYIAMDSLDAQESEEKDDDSPKHIHSSVSLSDIAHEAKGLGYKAHISGLSSSKDSPRTGWEDALAIYIRDHATVQSLPSLRRIMQDLMFEPSRQGSSTSDGSQQYTPSTPAERYIHLLCEDKIAILSFLCEICIASRVIRAHIDWADASLTELRKEKIEVNREKRRLMDEIAQLDSKIEPEGDGAKLDGSKPPTLPDRAAATPLPDFSSPAPGQSEDDLETKQNGNNSDGTDDFPPSSRRKRSSVLRRTSAKYASDAPLKVVGHGKDRAQARIKAAELRSAMAERRRLDEELNKTERRLEAIEREFRQLFGVGRTRHMGKDRFYNRYWWLDGMGIGHLVTSSGTASYGAGRVFVQGPGEFDVLVIAGRGGTVQTRQKEEDGLDGTLGPGEWGMYSEPKDIEELIAWLNVKGHRELTLKNVLTKWLDHILSGVKRRQADLATRPERRSTRGKGSSNSINSLEINREPYLAWANRHNTQNGR